MGIEMRGQGFFFDKRRDTRTPRRRGDWRQELRLMRKQGGGHCRFPLFSSV